MLIGISFLSALCIGRFLAQLKRVKKTLDKLTFILYSITIMTKTHFETIANNLNIALRNDPNAHNAITFLARNLADEFEAINPRFNRSKFLAVALA